MDNELDLDVPDVAESLLGYRVWRYNDDDRSLWSVTLGDPDEASKIDLMLSNTTPTGYWPKQNSDMGSVLEAVCNSYSSNKDHFPPDPDCTCGIYATYDLNTIARYIKRAPVLGLVQGFGTVIPGEADGITIGGFRAEKARIVCLFSLSEDFTIPTRDLKKVGREYGVPVITPWSKSVNDYASAVRSGTLEQLGV